MIDKEDIVAEYEKQLQKKDNEIEKLNNIINEIEKYCDELIIYKAVSKRIKELKGVDKE